jgi:hypothetical protein
LDRAARNLSQAIEIVKDKAASLVGRGAPGKPDGEHVFVETSVCLSIDVLSQ